MCTTDLSLHCSHRAFTGPDLFTGHNAKNLVCLNAQAHLNLYWLQMLIEGRFSHDLAQLILAKQTLVNNLVSSINQHMICIILIQNFLKILLQQILPQSEFPYKSHSLSFKASCWYRFFCKVDWQYICSTQAPKHRTRHQSSPSMNLCMSVGTVGSKPPMSSMPVASAKSNL